MMHTTARILVAALLAAGAAGCGTSAGGADATTDASTGTDGGADPGMMDMGMMDMGGMEMGGDAEAMDCAAFCAASLAACTGAHAQFADATACKTTCAAWPAGTPGAFEGNSLACRATHLQEVVADPAEAGHCDHTGGGGGGICGTLCDEYCFRVLDACTGANQVYADGPACQAACAAFRDDGTDGDAAGDTVQCRITHAGMAKADPATHCAHTRAVSAVCK